MGTFKDRRITIAGWAWFCVWAMLGASVAVSVVSLGPLFLAAIVVIATTVGLWRPESWRSAFGFITGIGVLLLYVAWVQRDGPGTTCWRTATAAGCDQHLNPLPWLALGATFVVAGLVGHLWRA